MHYYQLYGLIIASQIELPYAKTILKVDEDISIILTPDLEVSLENTKDINGFKLDEHGSVYFDSGHGWLYIEEGKTIKLKLENKADTQAITQYIMGSAMAVILQQRKTLLLHASAVSKDGRAMIITGPSGLGKSSTAALLNDAGYDLISDDMAAIRFQGDQAWIMSGPSIQKIGTDVLRHLNEPIDEKVKTLADGKPKYFRPFTASEKMMPISHIYCLARTDSTHSDLFTGPELKQFYSVYRNSFRFRLIGPLGFAKRHMEQCTDLYKMVTTKTLALPNDYLDFDNTVSLLDRDFSQSQDFYMK